MKEICRIEIPEYMVRVQLSKKRTTKYYKKKRNGGWYPRTLPKTYLTKLKENKLKLDKNNYLIDLNGNKIIANPRSANKPKFEKLSGNSFASGYGSPFIRAKLVRELKNSFMPHIKKQLTSISLDKFPLWIDWYLYTTIPSRMFDLSNFWFYYKYFEDCLFRTEDEKGKAIKPIIPDDNIKYITKPGNSPILCPVEHWNERKFVFIIYSDDRECVKNNSLWKNIQN